MTPAPGDSRPAVEREFLVAALLLAGLVLLFLAEPIVRYRSAHYCFADFVQSFRPINVEPGRVPANRMMGDPAVIYLPWVLYSRDQIREGRLPVWNPYNGGGVPHLANYQSGVLSLYNLPFYVLDLKSALLASAFLKLFAIALFTFLFLRVCSLGRAAAILGAVGFTFAGYHVAWLSGAITASAATLPASLFFSEVLLRRAETAHRSSTPARLATPLVGLTVSLTVGLLAGHPENLYFGGLFLASYLAFRLWQLRSLLEYRALAALAGRLLACAVMAVLISAVQLLPFFEYLSHSQVIGGRADVSVGLTSRPAHLWPLLLTPQVLGNAASSYDAISSSPVTFIEAISPYTGAMVLFLGGLALFLLRTSSHIRFFVALICLWLVYVFDPLGLAVAFRAVPGLSHLPITRSHDIYLFAVCCAAAWFLDGLIERRDGVPEPFAIFGMGLGVLLAGFVGARWLIGRYRDQIVASGAESLDFVYGELGFFAGTFAVGLTATAVAGVVESKVLRGASLALLIAVVFLQTGFLLRTFNPTIDDSFVYPVTPEMEKLQQIVGRDTLLVAGGRRGTLVADANLVYRLSLPNNYDGMWIRRYDKLYRRRFGHGDFPRSPLRFDRLGLELFGIDYVLGKGPLINTELADRRGLVSRPAPLGPLAPGGAIQSFTATEDRLQAVAVFTSCRGRLDAGALTVRLEDGDGHRLLAERTIPCERMASPQWVKLLFPAVRGSKGKQYRLVIHGSRRVPGVQVLLYAWRGFDYPAESLSLAGDRQEETLAFDFAYGLDAFEHLATLKDRRLYRYEGGRGRYYTVGRAVLTDDDEEALRLLEDPAFEFAEVVVLSDVSRPVGTDRPVTEPGKVEILLENATRIELRVTRSAPGYLVLAKPYFPGWKAAVDGIAWPLHRANYAFMAVEVPEGTSRVTVWYEPASVRWGAIISLTSLLAGCAWIGWRIRKRAR